jgi:hypothetical protein
VPSRIIAETPIFCDADSHFIHGLYASCIL